MTRKGLIVLAVIGLMAAAGCTFMLMSGVDKQEGPEVADAHLSDEPAPTPQTEEKPEASGGQQASDGQQATDGQQTSDQKDDEPLTDEEFTDSMDQIDEINPQDDTGQVEVEQQRPAIEDADGVLDLLQGWWYPADQSVGAVYMFEGTHYTQMGGNGNGTRLELDIKAEDITRLDEGWSIALGENSLYVPYDNSIKPVLLLPDGNTIVLARGVGDL